MDDVEADAIADAITAAFERKVHRANPAEVTSWRNSMEYMYKVLNTPMLPDGCADGDARRIPAHLYASPFLTHPRCCHPTPRSTRQPPAHQLHPQR